MYLIFSCLPTCYRTELIYFYHLSQLGLERTCIVLIFAATKKKSLPAARLHFTLRRFCTASIIIF